MKQGVINVALEKAMQGETLSIWGDGNGRKDYIFVEDFAKILFLLLDKWDATMGQVINVASGQLLSVNNIVHEIKQIIPSFEWTYEDAQKFDVGRFSLDTSKLKFIIGEYPFVSLAEGLIKTQEWRNNG